MHEEHFAQLKKTYPDILTADNLQNMPFGLEVGDGWYGILDFMFRTLSWSFYFNEEPIVLYQIKEKFGSLVVYGNFPRPLYRAEFFTLLSDWSKNTCDLCGQPGKLRSGMGWVAARCDEHDGVRPREDHRFSATLPETMPIYRHQLDRLIGRNDQSYIQIESFKLPDHVSAEELCVHRHLEMNGKGILKLDDIGPGCLDSLRGDLRDFDSDAMAILWSRNVPPISIF